MLARMPFTGPMEDRLAIRELIDTYADATNLRDAELWGSLFAEDARWELPDFPEYGDTVGRAAIVAKWAAAVGDHEGLVYIATPDAIGVDGNRATARLYTSEVYTAKDGATVRRRGRYDEVLAKRDGRWLITEHVFRTLHEE
jgi:uncharacterized protein (TIGR02246 family)